MNTITNTSHIPTRIINLILDDLKVSGVNLEVVTTEMEYLGICRRYGKSKYLIILRSDADIAVLAHELKHLEQYESGLIEWMRAEKEITEYENCWHELEACEYEEKWEIAV